jgi:hypothetical protein
VGNTFQGVAGFPAKVPQKGFAEGADENKFQFETLIV